MFPVSVIFLTIVQEKGALATCIGQIDVKLVHRLHWQRSRSCLPGSRQVGPSPVRPAGCRRYCKGLFLRVRFVRAIIQSMTCRGKSRLSLHLARLQVPCIKHHKGASIFYLLAFMKLALRSIAITRAAGLACMTGP